MIGLRSSPESKRGERESLSPGVLPLRPLHLEDKALWDAFRNGDDEALITIFDRYVPAMYRYGCKLIKDREAVQDCVQDLFLALCQKRGKLGETNAIKFYLFKALRRSLVRTQLRMVMPLFGTPEVATPSPEDALISEQSTANRKHILEKRLTRLSHRQREAIFLRYYEELSYNKIAEIMGVRKQSIYNLINESFAILKAE